MALFKIFNNFDNPDHTLPTSTHKGYCYFDVKTKLFWIDIADSNGVTLTSENISNYRVPLNANLAAAAGLLVNENGEWSSVPEKTSDLINDSGFLTSFTETDPIFNASVAHGITSTDITNWNNKSDFSGSYNDLSNKPTIPSNLWE